MNLDRQISRFCKILIGERAVSPLGNELEHLAAAVQGCLWALRGINYSNQKLRGDALEAIDKFAAAWRERRA